MTRSGIEKVFRGGIIFPPGVQIPIQKIELPSALASYLDLMVLMVRLVTGASLRQICTHYTDNEFVESGI